MIDNLKLAIDNKDWSLVEDFYRQLSGIVATKEKPKISEQKRKVIDAPRNAVDYDFTMRPSRGNITTKPNSMPDKKIPAKKSKASKKQPLAKASEIQFIDTGETLDEPGADKINDNVALTPRKRKPFKLVDMECILCKKIEQVAPLFKRDKEFYKCNSCLSKGKVNGPE